MDAIILLLAAKHRLQAWLRKLGGRDLTAVLLRAEIQRLTVVNEQLRRSAMKNLQRCRRLIEDERRAGQALSAALAIDVQETAAVLRAPGRATLACTLTTATGPVILSVTGCSRRGLLATFAWLFPGREDVRLVEPSASRETGDGSRQ